MCVFFNYKNQLLIPILLVTNRADELLPLLTALFYNSQIFISIKVLKLKSSFSRGTCGVWAHACVIRTKTLFPEFRSGGNFSLDLYTKRPLCDTVDDILKNIPNRITTNFIISYVSQSRLIGYHLKRNCIKAIL